MESSTLDVHFLWHFHQPHYGYPQADQFLLPWTRLHAANAYYDMGRHLETRPAMRCTFNFSGSLLAQLDAMTTRGLTDRWEQWSRRPPQDLTEHEKRQILTHFFSLSLPRGIAPLPRFLELYKRRNDQGIDHCVTTFSPADWLDLQVLFNLAWCGHFAARDFPLIAELRRQGTDFTIDQRQALLERHHELIQAIIPLYRRLAERGQIELSVSPMYHPIVPLLIDTEAAATATPDRPRPTRYRAPEMAAEHLAQALDLGERLFGQRPRGMWPSEGAISAEAYRLFADAGVDWLATDEAILANSLDIPFDRDDHLWRPWSVADKAGPIIFFRDRWLSDQIGFVYADNPAEEAAQDLVKHLEGIRQSLGEARGSVAIILDGENPWEHYKDNGFAFREALYSALADAPGLQPQTFADSTTKSGELSRIHPGSWIMGNYQIWIGHHETNAAWEWLRRAQALFDAQSRPEAAVDADKLATARRHLMIAQGSDWFWWYGDDFESDQDREFDALFRAHIAHIYRLLDQVPPPALSDPIGDHQPPKPAADSAPRAPITPPIAGTSDHNEAWQDAGTITVSGGRGAMFDMSRPLTKIRYGGSSSTLFVRFEPGPDFGPDMALEITLSQGDSDTVWRHELKPGTPLQTDDRCRWVFLTFAELAIPRSVLPGGADDAIELVVRIARDKLELARLPQTGGYRLILPSS